MALIVTAELESPLEIHLTSINKPSPPWSCSENYCRLLWSANRFIYCFFRLEIWGLASVPHHLFEVTYLRGSSAHQKTDFQSMLDKKGLQWEHPSLVAAGSTDILMTVCVKIDTSKVLESVLFSWSRLKNILLFCLHSWFAQQNLFSETKILEQKGSLNTTFKIMGGKCHWISNNLLRHKLCDQQVSFLSVYFTALCTFGKDRLIMLQKYTI